MSIRRKASKEAPRGAVVEPPRDAMILAFAFLPVQ